MAPEQVEAKEQEIDQRTDVYALGVILYELLTGKLPFVVKSLPELLEKMRTTDPLPPQPRRLNPRIPQDLEAIILKACAKEPAKRYQTAGDLADDLHRYLEGEPITARPVGAVEKVWRWARRKPALALLIAVLIAVFVMLFFGGPSAVVWYERQQARQQVEYERQQAEAARMRRADDLYNQGVARAELNDLPTAIDYYEESLALDPKNAKAWNNLGVALLYQMDFPRAIDAFQKALDIDPNYARAGKNRTLALELLTLEKRLPDVLHGDAASSKDLLTLANMCRHKKRYSDAAQLFAKAFAAEPKLDEDLDKEHRYEAARAAALAAARKGVGGDELNAKDEIRLRTQAINWLQTELATRANLLTKNPAQTHDDMEKWQRDIDLANLREEKELAKLGADERGALQKFWEEVDRLAKDARSRYTQTEHKGQLAGKERKQSYTLEMTAGKTYVVDMETTQFFTDLRLEDDRGNPLGKLGGISWPNLNSRIIFTAPSHGTYLIVATSHQQRGTGYYTLRIREFAEKK